VRCDWAVKLLIDMNLSPIWVEVLERQGWETAHWSTIGDPRAADEVIMEWARDNDYVVFTHDLDFGALLATTRAEGPSVIQVRTQDIMPQSLGERLVRLLQEYEPTLESGALVTVDEIRSRVRILPIN
jgi:predicted nuclease of predicted toxin-antitoxin system